jgi:tRNA(Ile)-lysidine synthase
MIEYDKSLVESEFVSIAVSMGVDSVVFSHFLAMGKRRLKLLHVNHQTKYAPKAEKAFLKYGEYLRTLDCHNSFYTSKSVSYVLGKDLDYFGKKEADLRAFRYTAFENHFRPRVFGSQLVVCHHLGDAVESYLMNCLNGQPEYYPIPKSTQRESYEVIRPFLKTSKANILYYAEKHDLLRFVEEDPSNKNLKFRRNWVRHKLIPVINKEYKGLEKIVRKRL